MIRMKLFLGCFLSLSSLFLVAQTTEKTTPIDSVPEISIRYEAAPGSAKWVRARDKDGGKVKVGEPFVSVARDFQRRFRRRSSATFWYDVVPADLPNRYVLRSHTHKNAIGVSGNCLFYGDFTHFRNWLAEPYASDFEGTEFGLKDYSIGLLYARQLCAKNRHRLCFETVPSYRVVKQSFVADQYMSSFPTVDSDGFDYERFVTVTDFEENVVKHCVTVPLFLRYDLFVFKHLSLFAAGGIDNLFTVSRDTEATFDATYAGHYGEELFNMVIDENGFYDFGEYPENRIVAEDNSAFRYSLYGTAMVGVQLFIGPVLSIEAAGVYHQFLFSNAQKEGDAFFCLSDAEGRYQSMNHVMKPAARNRLGVNVKLKINF